MCSARKEDAVEVRGELSCQTWERSMSLEPRRHEIQDMACQRTSKNLSRSSTKPFSKSTWSCQGCRFEVRCWSYVICGARIGSKEAARLSTNCWGLEFYGVIFQETAKLILASGGRVDFFKGRRTRSEPGRESFTSLRMKGISFLEPEEFQGERRCIRVCLAKL